MRALEISGDNWKSMPDSAPTGKRHFPEFDVCAGTLPEQFDIIIADQVFEHLLWPYRAGKNVYAMLAPGGYFLLSTPFLIRIHNNPTDCSRWTEVGMKHFLAECGFPLEQVQTGPGAIAPAWLATSRHSCRTGSRLHSLQNEPKYPIVVWALAQK